jgi:ribosomal protein L37E
MKPTDKTNEEVSDSHPTTMNIQEVKESTLNDHVASPPLYGVDVKFPFQWQYGKIVELTNKEKEDVNHTKRYRNKLYKKSCALCGFEGTIEFRKKSNNTYSLICRECAESYVRSAKSKKGVK